MPTPVLTPRTILRAGPEHIEGLLRLFEEASSGCYCRFWHYSNDDNQWLARCAEPSENRAELVAALRDSREDGRGMVALEDARAVGWLKLSGARDLPKLASRRVYRTLPHFGRPREGALVIGCMLVHPAARRTGVGRDLLVGAVAHARETGARAIEAFPRCAAHPLRDDELLMGPLALYRSLGFVQVDGPELYPVMRLALDDAP